MKKKILIVEDDVLNMKLFNDLLQAQGYETFQDKNGSDVLELASKTRLDLILMDIKLPKVSGLDLIKCLKNDRDLMRIPTVAVTAFAMSNDEERIKEGGFDGYIAKPILITSFLVTVAKFLSISHTN